MSRENKTAKELKEIKRAQKKMVLNGFWYLEYIHKNERNQIMEISILEMNLESVLKKDGLQILMALDDIPMRMEIGSKVYFLLLLWKMRSTVRIWNIHM